MDRKEEFKRRNTDFHIYVTSLQTKPNFSEIISSPSIQIPKPPMSDLTLKRKEARLTFFNIRASVYTQTHTYTLSYSHTPHIQVG